MELTATQFIYQCVTGAVMEGGSAVCRLCGGETEPRTRYASRISSNWNSEHFTSARESNYICSACSWMLASSQASTGGFFWYGGKKKEEIQKGDVRAGIAVSPSGIRTATWEELAEFLLSPPEPPFVAMIYYQGNTRTLPWNAQIAWQTDIYPLFSSGELYWFRPSLFRECLAQLKQAPQSVVANSYELFLAKKIVENEKRKGTAKQK